MLNPNYYTCIVCMTRYNPLKARAELKGFCSMRCQHKLEQAVGWKSHKPRHATDYEVRRKEIERRRRYIPGADPME